jgi:thioredoxin 1
MKEFTNENFEQEVLQSDIPVVVDFWATWCQPCLKLGPIVEELAGDYEGKAKFGKLNIENEQEIAAKYGILSIPTILFFKDGEVKNQTVGLMPKKKLAEALEKVL